MEIQFFFGKAISIFQQNEQHQCEYNMVLLLCNLVFLYSNQFMKQVIFFKTHFLAYLVQVIELTFLKIFLIRFHI